MKENQVVGVAQVQSDGAIQAHLSTTVVASDARGQGTGRRLVLEAVRRAGGLRIDTISVSDEFYVTLGAQRFSGFRLRSADLER